MTKIPKILENLCNKLYKKYLHFPCFAVTMMVYTYALMPIGVLFDPKGSGIRMNLYDNGVTLEEKIGQLRQVPLNEVYTAATEEITGENQEKLAKNEAKYQVGSTLGKFTAKMASSVHDFRFINNVVLVKQCICKQSILFLIHIIG